MFSCGKITIRRSVNSEVDAWLPDKTFSTCRGVKKATVRIGIVSHLR